MENSLSFSTQKKFLTLLFLCFFFLVHCATSFDRRGKLHSVRQGENIWMIAQAYRVDVQTLAEYNNIEDPSHIQTDMKLYIPQREKRPGFKNISGERYTARKDAPKEKRSAKKKKSSSTQSTSHEKKPIRVEHGRFAWPIDGKILSPFGYRNGRRHDGIDIKASSGTPIKASQEGIVAFSGKMRGYGNLILLRHDDDFFTAYAHNKINRVQKGQEVKQGQVIALVGATGRASGPHLHFEIRDGQGARNPLFFLPQTNQYDTAKAH